jgi:N-acetylmuramoyl-L-alanine amidase
MSAKKILIDPGHGGRDSGAVGPSRLKESDVNLHVARRLGAILAPRGLRITHTRTDDTFPTLTQRWQLANRENVDFVISIHCNSDGPTAVGIETLVRATGTPAHRLGQAVQKEMVAQTGDRDRGIKFRTNLAMLNGPRMPSILPEIGFISHPATEAKFRQANYLQLLAAAIAHGVFSFLRI